ncbi:GGDEF domain-containing protein [Desulfovibrio sp. OttesenSCG-928-C14]|nr:GGDEF domain-containing protein [Desulfovibrio sp. OttesenSCG-928-C14]
MSEQAYSDIQSVLMEQGLLWNIFDLSRIVDAENGTIVELKDGKLVTTEILCNNVLGTHERCENCSSIRAHYSKETVVKLEYANESVFLILSVPVFIQNRHLVVEIVKDITRSMTVDLKDQKFKNELPSIICKLNTISTLDALTGLRNRRYLDDNLETAIANCLDMNLPVSLAMIDIDHFKQINDRFGHQTGDTVLRNIGHIVKSFIRRGSDFAVRYGGDEMLLCLLGVPIQDCHNVCERIRQRIAEAVVKENGYDITPTVSIGVAESTAAVRLDHKELIALADKRLYQAKSNGRNQTVSE